MCKGNTSLYIFGAGSFTRCVLNMIEKHTERIGLEYWIVDKNKMASAHEMKRVISEDEFKKQITNGFYFNVAIADVWAREKIASFCMALGGVPFNLISDDFDCYQNVTIGDGAIICAKTLATTSIRIGKFFHGNIYSYIEHDCIIDDFVTFSPRVSCNGYVHVSKNVFIGSGAIIRNGDQNKYLTIGEGAVVGMGAVITKDVPAFTTVVGNPARVVW